MRKRRRDRDRLVTRPLAAHEMVPALMRLPADILEELEIELQRAHRDIARCQARIDALLTLRGLAASLVQDLRRPVTVRDIVRLASEPPERERRRRLVRALRAVPRGRD